MSQIDLKDNNVIFQPSFYLFFSTKVFTTLFSESGIAKTIMGSVINMIYFMLSRGALISMILVTVLKENGISFILHQNLNTLYLVSVQPHHFASL